MAIAVGDEVAIARSVSNPTLAVRGNVLFGVVIDLSAPNCDVLWENGQVSETIPTASLDKITFDNAGSQQLCTFTDAAGGVGSPAYQGQQVRRYNRRLDDAGDAFGCCLMRASQSGQLYEVLETALELLPGQ